MKMNLWNQSMSIFLKEDLRKTQQKFGLRKLANAYSVIILPIFPNERSETSCVLSNHVVLKSLKLGFRLLTKFGFFANTIYIYSFRNFFIFSSVISSKLKKRTYLLICPQLFFSFMYVLECYIFSIVDA